MPHEEKPNGMTIMRLMMFTVMISSMNAMMMNVVLPQIGREFHLALAQVSWLSSAYALIYAFGTVMYGKLADRYQLKSLLTFGLSLFAAGSLVGLVSQTFGTALLGRCLQAAGAAALPAMALIIPVRYFSTAKRGSALSMTAVGTALGGALAPVVSAAIVSIANWRWLFLPSLLMLLLIPLFRKYLDFEPKGAPRPFDWLGGGLLAASVAFVLLGVTNTDGGYAAAGTAAFILFAARIRTARDPFVQPAIFRNAKYTVALVLAFLIAGVGTSLFILTPVLFAEVYGLKAGMIGFAMVPAAAAAAILGRKGGKLADRKGNFRLYALGSSSIIACFALLSVFAGVPPLWISLILIFGNVGQSFVQIAMSNTVSGSLPKEQVGVGMGLFSMTGFLAQGIAAGVYGIVAAQGARAAWNPLHTVHAGGLFSNIYFMLAVIHIGILLIYRYTFARRRSKRRKEEVSR